MIPEHHPIAARSTKDNPRTCMACGAPLPRRRRRYCADTCRLHLLHALNRRTGLLRALNTRYATFYFTERLVIMDLLPYDRERIYSYLLPRACERKPVDDFCTLSNMLGALWWRERHRTHKRYLASRHVLDRAIHNGQPKETVIPATVVVPAVRRGNLIALKLNAHDLTLADIRNRIKQAYRCQVKKHHPDMGGTAQAFLKIQDAYEQLIAWSRNPTFTLRGGFTDKWLYQGAGDRWIQPVAAQAGTP